MSLDDITSSITAVLYATGEEAFTSQAEGGANYPALEPLKVMTLCLVVVRNGFMVLGKSAPASPENFNAGLGRKLAYEDAIRQLWPLMGFALRDRLSRGQP